MGIEPEKVLKQNGIAAQRGIEDAYARNALKRQQQDRDSDYGRAQNHDQAGGIVRPEKEWHAKPLHARRSHRVNRDDEIQSGEDGRKTVDKNSEAGGYDIRV